MLRKTGMTVRKGNDMQTKKGMRLLAVVLAVCLLATSIRLSPLVSKAETDDKPAGAPVLSDFYEAYDQNDYHITMKEAGDKGITVTHSPNSADTGQIFPNGGERITSNQTYSFKEGLAIELTDITSETSDYSLAMAFGTSGNKTAWYHTKGYMLLYGKSGNLVIYNTNSSMGDAVIVETDARAGKLGTTLSLYIRMCGKDCILNVNGTDYTLPNATDVIGSGDWLYLSFGIMSDFTLSTDNKVQNLKWWEKFLTKPVSYTLSRIYVPFGEKTNTVPSSLTSTGKTWQFQESDSKIKITQTKEGSGNDRVRIRQNYQPEVHDIIIDLEDIYSKDDNYAMAIAFGNQGDQWYDKAGYMLLYGKSGAFAVIATSSADHMNGPVVQCETREALGDKLSVNIRLVGTEYEIQVNGRSYTVPAQYESASHRISDPQSLYVAFGVMSDFTISDGKLAGLSYWQENVRSEAVSFVLDKGGLSFPEESVRELRPLAKYMAFMDGEADGSFAPERPLTRGEAIAALARLLVEEADIQDVYTSDFTDIDPEDTYYDIVAYMERCGFLPDFGTRLNAAQSIARGEFIDLLLDKEEVSSGVDVADVSRNDTLYGKICYAVEKGILSLDAGGNFNREDTVTRGEAAKAFCVYLGKTTPLDDPKVTFSDVTATTAYADYILLAANEAEYRKVTYQATSQESIQACIDKAIRLSETTDALATIELSEDVYQLTEPVVIDGAAYGAYEVVIVIKNAANSSPVISGNADLKAVDFQKVQGTGYYSYQLPASAKTGGSWPKFRDLYLNGERLSLARSEEYTFQKTFKDPVYADTNGQLIGYSNWIYVDNAPFAGIDSASLSTLELCINVEWMNKRWRVDTLRGVEADTGLMQLSVKEEEWAAYCVDGNKKDFKGCAYWFENHLSLLDEPGEFYYDDTNGVIYFYPYKNTDMSQAVISYPVTETLFDIKAASGITFEGITFTGTTSNYVTEHGFNGELGNVINGGDGNGENIHASAIYGEDSANIAVRGCTFEELGTNGIYMNLGTRNIVIKDSSFTDLAMSAVIMGKQRQAWNAADGLSDLIIDNNYVYNIGTDYPGSPAVSIARVKNIAFTHNVIKHTPYTGVMMGWIRTSSSGVSVHNAEVAYNHCEDNLYALNDGAGMYFCGANAWTDDDTVYNRVHDNYIKGTGYGKTYTGIYLDINASNYDIYENVIDGIVSSLGPIYNQNIVTELTHNNTLRENYATMSPIRTQAAEERNIQLIDNQKVAAYDKLPKEALAVVVLAGRKEDCAAAIPTKDTVVDMQVENPHLRLNKSEKSETASVVFTITNNSKDTATYSAERTNTGNIRFVPSTDALVLAAGESGVITGYFYDDTISGYASGNVLRELIDLAVLHKESGARVSYKRVIDVSVGMHFQNSGTNSGKLASMVSRKGVEVTFPAGTCDGTRLVNYKTYATEGDGVDIEVTDIHFWNGATGSIAIMLGNTYNGWYGDRGYMLVYGKSGGFSILATDSALNDPEQSPVVLTDTREALTNGAALSVNVRLEGKWYLITVNGKTYTVPAGHETYPLTDCENIYVAYGIMGDKSDSGTYQISLSGSKQITYTIAEMTDSRAGDIVFDLTDSFRQYRSGTAMTAPTAKAGYAFAGWYYDTECTQPVEEEKKTVSAGERVYAKFVDKDVLSVKFQFRYTKSAEGTVDKSSADMRLVTAVDGLDYANAGFVVTSGSNTKSYARTTVYTSLRGAGITYKPDVFSTSASHFVTLSLNGIKTANPTRTITVKPFWTTLDGTVVYGWQRTVAVQDGMATISAADNQ